MTDKEKALDLINRMAIGEQVEIGELRTAVEGIQSGGPGGELQGLASQFYQWSNNQALRILNDFYHALCLDAGTMKIQDVRADKRREAMLENLLMRVISLQFMVMEMGVWSGALKRDELEVKEVVGGSEAVQ